ncbi:LOW QUALITY PROTEIN: uncharacterized protein EMH_0027690 [Eimeria mitis]|uniref:Uncharacterized protein n=1 Tax=Eimeria mitis TaxID=44415 RepID=U6K362_9EIME|nr:LOW QUALITY PROTEIN: uncharacterized protein EMH_0027690 [Eimeria mitis]CDJ30208.1 hypothetical protein EMH_0027690 [Eimeria mitis]
MFIENQKEQCSEGYGQQDPHLARNCGDCPSSRPTLQLQRRGKGEAARRLLPPWIFAHEIQNFGALQTLQQQATLEAGAGRGVRTPEGSLHPLAVNVVDSETGDFLGCALFHSRPLIAARVLEGLSASTPLNIDYVREKLSEAAARRRGLPRDALQPAAAAAAAAAAPAAAAAASAAAADRETQICSGYYRLINGESDGLPGVVVDLFGNAVSIQQLTRGKQWLHTRYQQALVAGSELLTAPLVAAIQEALRPAAVVLRNDSLLRELERDFSMSSYSTLISGELNGLQWIEERGCCFPVDLLNSPDTGWYYDRREARAAVAQLSGGGRMLDLHCHSAAFSITALRSGAARCSVCVDLSSDSLQLAAAAAAANGMQQQLLLQQADALQWMLNRVYQLAPHASRAAPSSCSDAAAAAAGGGLQQQAEAAVDAQFDIIVIDPPPPHRQGLVPAFTDKLLQLAAAAARLLADGGRLVVVESSRFIHLQQLMQILTDAVTAAGRTGSAFARAAATLEMHGGPTLDCPQDLRSQGVSGMNWVMLQLS